METLSIGSDGFRPRSTNIGKARLAEKPASRDHE